ncbi:hypothetical protein KKF84_21090 [Myxococcota bacterium]|nr:hypothetical protein [Myxococcota bacterium]MBU1537822.1 hypothetical protein [Myxococcota bacterium]
MSKIKIPVGFPVKQARVFVLFGAMVTVLAFLPPPMDLLPSVNFFFHRLFGPSRGSPGKEPPQISAVTEDITRLEKSIEVITHIAPQKVPAKILVKKLPPVSTGQLQNIPGAKYLANPCLIGSSSGCGRWALDFFYDSLAQTTQKKKITRIGYFGDSIIALDKVTSFIRTKFQERFGNSGPGFFHMVPIWKWLKHRQIALHGREWETETMLFPKRKQRFYGYGGVLARTIGPGASTTMKIRSGANTAPTRMVAFYIKNSEGGHFYMNVDGKRLATVNTRGEKGLGSMHEVKFAHGTTFEIEAGKGGVLLLTGAVLENENPGVVVDSMSLTGGRLIHFSHNNPDHFAHILSQRRPDLLIFHFGINEADTGIEPEYEAKVSAFLRGILKRTPGLSCMVAGPSDKVTKKWGEYKTKQIIHYIIKVQRKIALESGCAFFNTWEAMGGEASIVKWYEHRPRLAIGDLTHITNAGGDLLGSVIYLELMKGYVHFMESRP